MSGHVASPHDDRYRQLLRQAADAMGMEAGYWDIWGQWHEASDDVQRGILSSLGIPCGDENQLTLALRQRAERDVVRLAPPVIVRGELDQPIAVEMQLPLGRAGAGLRISLAIEGGQTHETNVDLSAIAAEPVEISGVVRKRIVLPVMLPNGYHEARFHLEGGPECSSRVIVSPEKAWLPESLGRGERRAGLAVSLYGIHGARTWGCGDFTALREVIDWVALRLSGSFVAVNPLCALFNRQPFNTSPYLPNSIFFRNFIYLDIDRILDLEDSAAARKLRQHPGVLAEIDALNRAQFVEYERVARIKRRFLLLLFRDFYCRHYRQHTARGIEFHQWVEKEGTLLDRFAVFSALDDHHHRRDPDVWIWQQWPTEHHDPRSDAVARFAAGHPRAVLFHKYVQWQIDLQAAEAQRHARERGMETGLFHDLPLATDGCGFDLWANPEFFVRGCRVGAPPDDFSPKGQDWSFPPPNTEAHRADGYRLFAESLRRSARHGGALRLDHVMRLFRLYWIPDGFDATNGTYVRDHPEDLLRILSLESHRLKVLIVGEDLGTVEPYMREALARSGILSYRLFYFERNEQGRFRPPSHYPVQALVSSTTHDLPTLAGFWIGRDIEARESSGLVSPEAARHMREERQSEKQKMLDVLRESGFLPPDYPRWAGELPDLTGELHNAIMGFLAFTPSLLLTVNQEDLTKEVDQQNLPGSTWQYPNWRRKMKFSVEELTGSQVVEDFAAMFRNWLAMSHRSAERGRWP